MNKGTSWGERCRLVAVCAVACACGDYVSLGANQAKSKTVAVQAALPSMPSDTAAVCAAQESDLHVLGSSAEFLPYAAGVWLKCDNSVFRSTAEVGFEIGADGNWSKVYAQADGQLVRGSDSPAERGQLAIDVTPLNPFGTLKTSVGVSFEAQDGSFDPAADGNAGWWFFSESPSKLLITDMGGDFLYIRVGRRLAPPSPAPLLTMSDTTTGCALSGSSSSLSVDELKSSLPGGWIRCAGPDNNANPMYRSGSGHGEIGFELLANGDLRFLAPGPQPGTLTRKTGFTGQGFWSVEDNGYGMAQTELHDLQSNAFVFPRWLSPDVFFDDSNGTVVRVNLSQP